MLYVQIIFSIKMLHNKFWTVIFLRAQVRSPTFWKKRRNGICISWPYKQQHFFIWATLFLKAKYDTEK